MPRKIIVQPVLFILFAVSALHFQAHAATPIVIQSPVGGEVFFIGQSQPLRIRSRFKTLRIELSRDGGATFEPLGELVNLPRGPRDVFVWNVNGAGTFNAIIKATGVLRQSEVSVMSSPFAIAEPAQRVGPGQPPTGGPGTYARANITIDADGRVLAASDGDPVNLGTEVTGVLPSARLADGAVITTKIAARAVTADKINSDPASSGFVLAADGTGGAQWVDNSKAPAAGSITTDMLADGSVTTPKLADGAVNLATKVSGTLADTSLSTNIALLGGRAGSQTLNGGTGASENLILLSTSNAAKGPIVLNPNGGNVGIGTASPGQKLSVAGVIESTTGGIRFPDGSTQTTAGTNVPSGYSILGDSATAPAGYTYTGSTLQGSGAVFYVHRKN